MDVIIVPLIKLLLTVINLYVWVVVASVVLSWLVAFGVVNTSNRFVYMMGDVIHRITEPL
ncbi:MAG: YggT family protein, partial [Rhodospirillaceae bacterium]|nr:YggT family protein [Rhodospirillaceae bacterium]